VLAMKSFGSNSAKEFKNPEIGVLNAVSLVELG